MYFLSIAQILRLCVWGAGYIFFNLRVHVRIKEKKKLTLPQAEVGAAAAALASPAASASARPHEQFLHALRPSAACVCVYVCVYVSE